MAKGPDSFEMVDNSAARGALPWILAAIAIIVVILVGYFALRPDGTPGTSASTTGAAPRPVPDSGTVTAEAGKAAPSATPGPPAEPAVRQASPPAEASRTRPDAPARTQALVHFDFGSAAVTNASALADFRSQIASFAGTVMISGHSDSIGSDEVNQRLSEARADSAREWLRARGLPAAVEIQTRGYGRTQPTCTDDTEACRARNRRAELVFEKR